MAVPTLTLDSKYPGLMAVAIPFRTAVPREGEATVRMTREEARDFGIAVLAMSEQGFMRYVAPEPTPVVRDPRPLPPEDGSDPLTSLSFRRYERDEREWLARHEDDASVGHEHPYADELHLGGG